LQSGRSAAAARSFSTVAAWVCKLSKLRDLKNRQFAAFAYWMVTMREIQSSNIHASAQSNERVLKKLFAWW
jgi:hypothetical protein